MHEGVYKNIHCNNPVMKYSFMFLANFQTVGDASKITALAKFLTVCLDYRRLCLLVFSSGIL